MSTTNGSEVRAMLVRLNISMWTASVGDSEAAKAAMTALGVDQTFESGSETGRVTKFLIDPKAFAQGTKLRGAARKQHEKLTSPYSDDGTRIIAGAGYRKYLDGMTENEREWWAWYNGTFKPEYPRWVSKARQTRKADFRGSDYPDFHLIDLERGEWIDRTPSTQLDRKFGFSVTPAAVPVATHFDSLLGVSQADMNLIRSTAVNDANQRIERAVNSVWERMEIVLAHMIERLKACGTPLLDTAGNETGRKAFFTDSLTTNLTDLLELIPILNITGDPRITAVAARMNEELTSYSPQILRKSDALRGDVLRSAENIMSSMLGTRRITTQKVAA